MKNLLRVALAILASSVLFTSHALAQAQFKPTAPVKIIVAFPPGGGTDAVSRILAERLTQMWNQQVIVENRAGAQGNIGTAYATKQPADGYTMMIAHQGVLTVNPHLYKEMGFDALKDVLPVARVTQQPFVLVAHPSVPANNLKELEALAKSKPGKLNYGSSATGPQLAVELFKYNTGSDLMHIAYKGAGPAVIDLLGGNIDLLVANPTSVSQHIKSGKLKAIVLFGRDPVGVLPGVPTAIEAGYPALADIPEWYGLAVPKGTPPNVVAQLNHDINAVLNDPAVAKRISDLGLNAAPTTPTDFSQQIKRDYDRWGELIKKAGIKGE